MTELHLRQLHPPGRPDPVIGLSTRRLLFTSARLLPLVVTALLGVSACASLPAVTGIAQVNPFEPGIIRVHPEICDRHGGISLSDALEIGSEASGIPGIGECRIGEPIAVYTCDNDRRIARLHQKGSGQELLQWSDAQYDAVTGETFGNGSRWSGEHVTVVETNHGVIVTTAEQRSVCGKITANPEA